MTVKVKTRRIWGPPGTGKTTHLLNIVELELSRGIAPENIGFYTFTRAAAGEAIARARDKFTVLDVDKQLLHFRTIHSECYRLLGLTRAQVLTGKRVAEFCGLYGYRLSIRKDYGTYRDLIESPLMTKDDHLLFFEGWYRAKMYSNIQTAWRDYTLFHHDCPGYSEIIEFNRRYSDYKKQTKFLDFTDMLTSALQYNLRPDLKVLIVDESQDLNPLEFELVKFWSQDCERFYMAGDPLQAIYIFQGAEPNLFFNIPAEDKLLRQSYRLPAHVYDLAIRQAHRTDIGKNLSYLPKKEHGFVNSVSDFSNISLDMSKKYFILARNRYFLDPISDWLIGTTHPFMNLRGISPLRDGNARAFRVAALLTSGQRITVMQAHDLIKVIPSKGNLPWGAKSKLASLAVDYPNMVMSPFDLAPYFGQKTINLIDKGFIWKLLAPDRPSSAPETESIAYLERLVKKHGADILDRAPNIVLGTFHSIKGMECDIAICMSDMSSRTYRSYYTNQDNEIPAWYVAITRAKEGVTLVGPQSNKYYDW